MRLSDLLDRPVVTESGEKLGHVFDVRVRRRAGGAADRADQRWKIEGLVIGRRGLKDRLGLAGSKSGGSTHDRGVVAWDTVLEVGSSEIRVRAGTEAA